MTEPFTRLKARAVPLLIDDLDTDAIFPARFAKTVSTTGLGDCLFANLRFDEAGSPVPDFPLNRKAYAGARILLTGSNFGCGSSREHAVWALHDFGIRAVIAPSFSDIFYANCFKNGLLPVVLPVETTGALAARVLAAPEMPFEIDLEQQRIIVEGAEPMAFAVDDYRRQMLLRGLDEIGLSLESGEAIEMFESAHFAARPWLSDGTGKREER